MAPKRITILQHSPIVRPYALYKLLEKLNIETNLCSFNTALHDQGWHLPTEVTPTILLGGPQSVYEQKENPWLLAEFDFIKKSLDLGQPSFGICLGGQVLSHVLGAEVKRSPAPEVGWYPIRISKAAERLGLVEGESHFFQWHFDSFEAPADAELLFEGTGSCKSQGYVWKDQALSVQFHPEMTYEGASLLQERFAIPKGTTMELSACIKTEFNAHSIYAHGVLEKLLLWFQERC